MFFFVFLENNSYNNHFNYYLKSILKKFSHKTKM